MLKIEKYIVPNEEQWLMTIEGARNPMNSWDRIDSRIEPLENGNVYYGDEFVLGDNDRKLLMNLAKAGTEHSKYRRMIPVYATITAPLYWWKESDTYMFKVQNSCSTMHKIHSKEFTLDDFSHEHLVGLYEPGYSQAFIDISDEYDETGKWCSPLFILEEFIIKSLNANREMYIETKDKKYWWQMIQLLPSSYNQKRTVFFNYEVLAKIYRERKKHKLDEWHTFCDWIKTLPYSELITMEE